MPNCLPSLRLTRLLSGLGSAALLLIAACDSSPTEPDTGPNAGQRLSVGESTTCALGATGTVWCWGENSALLQYGVLGVSSTSTPSNTGTAGLTSLANGHGNHFCGTTATNLGKCWGRTTHGQLGSSSARTNVSGDTVLSLPFGNWIDLTVSRLTTCGVTNQNIAYCWGTNQRGEGGNSTRSLADIARTPRGVESTRDFKAIAPGWVHTCAITVLGEALCWGDNKFGQLGLGAADTTAIRLPLPVKTTVRFEQISSGANYTCGISLDHSAYCWGHNETGALGDGTTTNRAEPTLVSGSLKFKRIVTSSGFGGGTTVTLPNATAGGVAHTCALTESNTAYCWGWNGAGQLGDGTFVNRLVPVAVTGGRTFTEIGLGGAHTCGMLSGAISCWGANAFGQLGNGSLGNSATPGLVGTPFNTTN